jgi:hypothetical protein
MQLGIRHGPVLPLILGTRGAENLIKRKVIERGGSFRHERAP